MNSRRAFCQRRGVEAIGDNHVSFQAPAEGVAMPINLAGLTDAEVRAFWPRWNRASP